MKLLYVILFLTLLISCGKKDDANEGVTNILSKYFPTTPMDRLDGRPPILVVGDSISIGYTPHLQEQYPEYQVIHNNENGRGSRFGVYMIDYWASHSPTWEICVLNHGMWDIITINEIWYVNADEYKSNLKFEIDRLKQSCKKIIMPNTTRVPENALYFGQQDLIELNAAMEDLGNDENIPVCDLNSFSETISHLHTSADEMVDVHYTEDGYEALADKLTECIDNMF